jgi:hypothetical protein
MRLRVIMTSAERAFASVFQGHIGLAKCNLEMRIGTD